MDSSSSTSSPAILAGDSNNNISSNNRDGALSPTAAASLRGSMEDDVALSVAAGLAKEAALLFQAGKFAECVSVLNQLLHKKEDDPKILHNIAIAEYFQDGCSDPKRLLEVLTNVKKQSEALAQAAEEQQTESVGSSGKLAVGSKGNSNVSNSYSVTSNLPVVYTDEFDTSVAMFNMAVIWFHLHEFARSYTILDALYQTIEPIDEGTALRICLLLLDVALVSNHASRAADVISYVEKVFCVNSLTNQVDNGSSLHQPTMVSKSASFSATIAEVSNSDSASSANVLESSLSRTLSEEALEDESLQLLSSLDIAGENLPRPSSIQSSNDVSRTQTDDSISTVDLRLKLHLYKVSFLLLTRNIKAAKREVKMAMNIARGKDYTRALYLKSQLEYARGNHRKAFKLLMASSNRPEVEISSIYYNNLGCIYYRLGKYHTSGVFFSKALSNSSTLLKEKPVKLLTLSQGKSRQLIYNCGLMYLASGKPILAAQCFYKASLIYYNRPLLWLRVAECCLMALEKGLLKSNYSSPSDGSDVKVHVVGKGKWRQLSLEDGFSRTGRFDFVGNEFSFSNSGLPNLSVSLARQCLLNALHLLESSDSKYLKSGLLSDSAAEGSESGSLSSKGTNYKNLAGGDPKLLNAAVGSGQANTNGEVKEQKGGNGQNTSLLNSVSDYEDTCRKENQMIKQALLADLAYVELELENPLKALSTARSLLKLFECSRIYVFLGNLYAAEALCLLNRPKEAAEHLFVYVAGGSNVELPYSQDDLEKWRVEKMVDFEEPNGGPSPVNVSSSDEFQGFAFLKPEEARGTICANLAVLGAAQGDLEVAQEVVQVASRQVNSPQVTLTAIYLDLLQGKTQDALAKLKQCDRIRFLPVGLTLDGSS